MEVHTNLNQVKELITTQTIIKVKLFNHHVPENKEVDLFLQDDHLPQLTEVHLKMYCVI